MRGCPVWESTTSQAEFAKELKAALADYDKYKKARRVAGAAGLDHTRAQLHSRFASLTKRGPALAKDNAALQAIDAELTASLQDADRIKVVVSTAFADIKDAKSQLDALVIRFDKAAATARTEAAAKEKAAAKEPKLAKEAAAAKARSEAASTDAAKVKEKAKQSAEVTKAVQKPAADVSTEVQNLKRLLPTQAWKTQAWSAAQKTAQEQPKAQSTLAELERMIKLAAMRRRADAPSAKPCEIERVDFKTFDYPSLYGDANVSRFKRGKAAGREWAGNDVAPKIASVKFLDLDGNGKNEAVVFIEGPPSPHAGPENELRFMELDDQCRVQQIGGVSGGVFEGALKGKAYFYGSTILESVEGQGGMYATGTELVELRYLRADPETHVAC